MMSAAFHSFKVGNMDCTILLDGASLMGVRRVVKGFPDATESDYRQAYENIGLSLDEADLAFNILILKIGDETILVDAGEAGKPYGGLLPESMKLAGIDPESITLVIITHSHGDHVLGLLTDDNNPVFPRAKYVMSKIEMDYWKTCLDDALPEHRTIVNMLEKKDIRLIEMNEEIVPGVTAIPLAGHTPGQIGLQIESEGEQLFHLADMLHIPIQFAHPEWSSRFDTDTAISVPTRHKILNELANTKSPVLFYHLTFPGIGYVEKTDDRLVWKALLI